MCRNDKITFELDEGQVNALMSSFRDLKKKYPEGERPDMPQMKPVCEESHLVHCELEIGLVLHPWKGLHKGTRASIE